MDESASFLMEKLRAKGGTYKSFKEYSKSIRMTLLEKRYALEVTEKNYLQECLDLLQQNILVSTLPAVVERLEVICRHLGLKFVSGSSRLEWFISCDMFYVEVVLESNGRIKDVKIHHDGTGERQSCEDLKASLENRDFKDVTLQLEGLLSIYNLNADQKTKGKAFISLQFLEADIMQLFDLQCCYLHDPFDIIYKSDVGLVLKRRGGHPMKIIYFVSPYDLLDLSGKTYKPLSLDLPEVDYSVSLCLESSSTNKLQTQNLVKVIKSEKMDENVDLQKPAPLFEELTPANTSLLPACFVMKLKERMPMCELLVNEIREITDIEVNKCNGPNPLLSLIKREIHKKHIECAEDSSIVTLPDQRHCYIMTNNSDLQAYIVQSIPFSHPSHISKILPLLRRQALFNSFVASCIRPRATEDDCDKLNQNFPEVVPCDSDHMNGFGLKLFGSEDYKSLSNFNESPQKPNSVHITMFEVMPLSLEQITVSFEHPVDETLITVELDLNDVSNLRCNISMASEDSSMSLASAQECAGRALQRSFSIPATMRVLIRLWESQTESSDEEDLNESSTNNDIADMGEVTDNHMETDNGKDINDCPTVDFNSGVGIKIETSDSCENSLDGFPSLVNRNGDFNADGVFTVPTCTSSTLRYPPFDAEMLPVGSTAVTSLTTNSSSNSFDQSSFLDNANEQPMFELKNERTDLTETLPFFNSKSCGNSKSDTFVAKGPSQQQRNDCEIVIDSSSDSEQSEQKDSAAVLIADAKDPSPGSNSSLEFSALNDPSDVENSAQQADFNIDHCTMEVNNLEDVQQFLKMTETAKITATSKMTSASSKNDDANAFAASILPELEGKTLMSPSISITPVTSTTIANALAGGSCNQNVQSLLNSMCLDRRPGIDVSLTPFSTAQSASSSSSSTSLSTSSLSTPTLPPSLTITPISIKDDDRIAKERSNGSASNAGSSKGQKLKSCDDKVRIERKKKRKHDDSGPMGPPEKIPAKAEQLCKPVSVTIKPAEVIIPRSPSPSGAVARKFAVSPTQSLPLSLIGRVSPNSAGPGSNSSGGSSGGAICSNNNSTAKSSGKSSGLPGASSALGGSPKMSSSNVSPKHSLTSSSPKNVSSGSSGKPSMSALKQVVTSPSSGSKSSNNNNEAKSKSHKESSSREYKEKKNSSNGGSGSSSNVSSGGRQSPKPKSSSGAKFNKAESSLSGSLLSPQYDAAALGTSGFETKFASSAKAKKGGLMAVVDRLNLNQISKSEDGCNNGSIKTVAGNGNGSGASGSVSKDIKISASLSVTDVKGQSAAKGSNEYMIKHHNDGIKMTINRRAARDSLASGKSGSIKDSGAPGSDSPKHKTNVSGSSGVANNSSGSVGGSQAKKSVSTSKSSPVSGASSMNKMSGNSSGSSGSSSSSGGSSSGPKHSSKLSSNVYKSKSNHSTKGSHSSESGGSRKEKVRPSKTHSSSSSSTSSDKSIFAGIPKRSSPSTMDAGGDGVEKQYKPPYQPSSAFPKNLANYQIPKISDRNKISGGGENEVKKSAAEGPSAADGAAKDAKPTAATDSISSPHKMAFAGGLEERGILTEAAKNLNTYESSKPKQTSSGNENSLEPVSGVTSQHQMTANCSMASVQSADSIKLNFHRMSLVKGYE